MICKVFLRFCAQFSCFCDLFAYFIDLFYPYDRLFFMGLHTFWRLFNVFCKYFDHFCTLFQSPKSFELFTFELTLTNSRILADFGEFPVGVFDFCDRCIVTSWLDFYVVFTTLVSWWMAIRISQRNIYLQEVKTFFRIVKT